MSLGEGDIGLRVWFEAPIVHRMYGVRFAWHGHIVCVQVHATPMHFGVK